MPQVLVVDNDEAIREVARYVLEDGGYVVAEAPDGATALHLLRVSEQPMVVLLDLVMPHLSGMEMLKLVGHDERLSQHSFVVWTASRVPLPRELLAALDVPLVPKPVDMDELLAVVAQAAARLDEAESA